MRDKEDNFGFEKPNNGDYFSDEDDIIFKILKWIKKSGITKKYRINKIQEASVDGEFEDDSDYGQFVEVKSQN